MKMSKEEKKQRQEERKARLAFKKKRESEMLALLSTAAMGYLPVAR